MAIFTPCQGKNACRDNGVLCLTCGRKLSEISKLRDLMQSLTALAIDYNYENLDDYTQYIARKVAKMTEYQRQEQAD
ncbi:MAG: hypothetical protein AAES65_03830 [Candidatus Thiodiazotropha sp. (ex. Lucinoma kazani)]